VPIVQSSAGDVEYLVTGAGRPVTVFVPGLAMSIVDTRPFASGVAGTKAFLHLRGHGRSSAPAPDDAQAWTYEALADDVAAVADEVDARQGVGVSLGAGAVLALAVREPERFTRLVLALPATLDPATEASEHVERARGLEDAALLADALDAHDAVAVAGLLVALQPESVRSRPDVKLWSRRHADALLATSVSRALRTLPGQTPIVDASVLASLEVPVLVLAQRDDWRHPLVVAENLAAVLPRAQLEVCDGSWLWSARDALRAAVSSFLSAG